ncbi:MAG TPA: nucleotide pyrophosphohydrolase [Methanothrix sp.]|nr:nucleotide pyrophosphohydrolase [Methanothrix sp.]
MADRFDEVKQKLLQFRDQRDWARYNDPKNLAEAISIESGELLENFLWKTVAESRRLNDSEIQAIGQEAADIFIYLIYLCEELDIDLMEEATKKLKLNENRFPIKAERSKED